MKKINQNLIQFSGKLEIADELDEDKYVLIMGQFDFTDVKLKPTEDGSYDRTYNISPISVQATSGENKLIGKPKRRGSQRMRSALWHEYQKTPITIDFESYYDNVINKIIVQLPEVLNYLGE